MERNLVATELGQIALSSAMIREILQWITMELQFNTKFSLQFTIVFLTGATGFAVLLLLIIRPLVNIVVERTPPGKPIKESYIVLLLLGPLVWAAISDTFGIYFIMGTFLYGLVLLNGPPLATTIIERYEDVHNMIALIEACNPTTQSPLYVYVVHLIELVGKSTPILLPMNKNNRKSLSVDYPNTNHILRAFENYSNNSSGPLTVHSYVNVAPYRSMHGNHVANTIRNLNTKGTLGILVDRYSVLSWSSSKLSFDVGIFFIGGKDDREALALGIQMLERPNTRVTLFRFVLPTKQDSKFVIYGLKENEEEVLESTLDESLIDEFISKNDISSDIINVVYHEVVVEDCIQVLEAIRGMEKDYADQLGILGDMLASNEFCNGKVPVLVMQCGDEKRVKQLEKVGHNQLFL
ncbi:hypothetical protein JHK84_032396 [Glycine max]|nr:hypothetical protein JHK85_032828 [Glycine max]KAG4995432.1 hypothetical protein JHK86_032259 [Glycine max]KAG5146853.1 hypothetical protein JHK84_032396 [Glycine max]